jgi:YjbE family integral membrane protein
MTSIIGTAQITGAADLISAYLSGGFLFDFVTVVVANIMLSGDNAVVIALAARSLPPRKRIRVILLATVGVILMRVLLTYFAAMLLVLPCVRLTGGILVLFIALKLLLDRGPEEEERQTSGGTLRMIGVILLADLAMSLDNILAVAGASKGNPALLFLGLGVGIPIVAFGSGIVSRLMTRYPAIIYAGCAILGKIGSEMILTDPLALRLMHAPGPAIRYGTEAAVALGVVATGIFLIRLRDTRHPPLPAHDQGPFHVTGWDIR